MTHAVVYHYVRPPQPALPHFRYLSIESFQRQLDHFETTQGFADRHAFLESFRTGEPAPGVVLTFDDGVRDHVDWVLPILAERGLWGIFYVCADATAESGHLLDVHRCHHLLGVHGGETMLEALRDILRDEHLDPATVEKFRNITYLPHSDEDAINEFKRILNYYVSYEWRTQLLDELFARFVDDEAAVARAFYLDHNGLRQLHASGMILGNHGVDHRVMSRLTHQEQSAQIEDGYRFLEDITGEKGVRTFCYPYGGFSTFTEETEHMLDAYETLFSFNVEARDISSQDLRERPQALPRHNCRDLPHGRASIGGNVAAA